MREKQLRLVRVLIQDESIPFRVAGATQSGLSLTCRNENTSNFSGGDGNPDLHGNTLMTEITYRACMHSV